MEIQIKCTCGEIFTYNLADTERLREEWEGSGVVPLIVPHKDHFITIYLDKSGVVRSVEKVLLADKEGSSRVARADISEEAIKATVEKLRKQHGIQNNFYRFVSSLLVELENSPEALFIAGEYIGYNLWKAKRNKILVLGATYQLNIDLLIRSEIQPIIDLTGDTKLLDDQTIQINNVTAPQFAIGLTQGIINAISEYTTTDRKLSIVYSTEGNSVMFSLYKE